MFVRIGLYSLLLYNYFTYIIVMILTILLVNKIILGIFFKY